MLIVVASAASVFAGRLIHPFLAMKAPAKSAQLLVVEGWLDIRELDQAIEVIRQGRYQGLVTTGGPFEKWSEFSLSSNYADLAASYLKTHGLENFPITAIPSPASTQERSYLSAVKLRDWIGKRPIAITRVDVFSTGAHARRSHMLYRMALGATVEVGIIPARSTQYDEDRWWQTSVGTKSVLGETISLIWTVCCFHPPPPGTL